MSLRIEPATRKAADYACQWFHYAQTPPTGKRAAYSVFEGNQWIGVVMFGHGAGYGIWKRYANTLSEFAELTRVALSKHTAPVSQIISICLKLVKREYPRLRVIVSYADPEQGHRGGVYQAGNWIYLGRVKVGDRVRLNGRVTHPRSVSAKYNTRSLTWLRNHIDPNATRHAVEAKHIYLYPLDNEMRLKWERVALPYPSAAKVQQAEHPVSNGEGKVQLLSRRSSDRNGLKEKSVKDTQTQE